MNFKELEKKYKDMDDEKWEKLSDEEKKEYDMYTFERFMRTSPFPQFVMNGKNKNMKIFI